MARLRGMLSTCLVIAAAACSSTDLGPEVAFEDGFRELAGIHIDSSGVRTLVATLTLENPASTDRPITWHEDCDANGPLVVRMYRGTTLVWDSKRHAPHAVCAVDPLQTAVSAHGSASWDWRLPISEILGDSLEAGSYDVTVQPALISPQLVNQLDGGSMMVADPLAVAPGTNLNGTWHGSSGGLSLSIALTWTADSVRGTGTYGTSSSTTGPCGAPTLKSMGVVMYTAMRQGDVVSGHLSFDDAAYVPPYGGRLRSADRFDGTIFAVDVPGCALTLTRAP